MAKDMTVSEIVESHKPKNFKYKYLFNDTEFLNQLICDGYDVSSLDTIHNDDLVNEAINVSNYVEYERDSLKSKNPTVLDDGIVLSKEMATKTDKKLLSVLVGKFDKDGLHYVVVRLHYEKFDIVELFIMI